MAIKYHGKQVSLEGKSHAGDTIGVRIFGKSRKTHYVSIDALTADTTDELREAVDAAPLLGVYAVIDAEGRYGDRATVYATYYDRAEAWGYAANHLPAQLIYGHDLEVGKKIHSTSIGTVYRVIPTP